MDRRERQKESHAARKSWSVIRRAIRGTQVAPIDIGAQVFAADGAGGGFFDFRATIGRYLPDAVFPLTNH